MTTNARICQVEKRSDFEGYGFNLHSEIGKQGQYIGHIEVDSPAEQCGLLKGDIIIEVNGSNVSGENHKQVVSRIKENSDHVTLLVIDPVGNEYCSSNSIPIDEDLVHNPRQMNFQENSNDRIKSQFASNETNNMYNEQEVTERSNNTAQQSLDLDELTIEQIRAKTAHKGAQKRANKANPTPFKDRAMLFQQL